MKIKIEKGQTIQEALQKLERFFDIEGDWCDVLQDDATLNINLCSKTGRECPVNRNNYYIGKEETQREEDMLVAEMKSNLVNYMLNTAFERREKAQNARKETAKAERYLRQAKEKGLSTVAKWEEKLERAKEYEKVAPGEAKFYNEVLYCIENGKTEWECVIEEKNPDSPYFTFRILPILDRKKEILSETIYFSKDGFFTEKPQKTSWLWGTKKRKERS